MIKNSQIKNKSNDLIFNQNEKNIIEYQLFIEIVVTNIFSIVLF